MTSGLYGPMTFEFLHVDWQEGEGDQPIYLQVSRGDLVLHLSSHHGDGTPGTAVFIETHKRR
jgi:hypothetical protein